jgi:hypothetical protein
VELDGGGRMARCLGDVEDHTPGLSAAGRDHGQILNASKAGLPV